MRIDLIHDSGGYREEETPCPISNQEAKLFIADNTLPYWDGNVGRCQFRDSYIFISSLFISLLFDFCSISYLLYPEGFSKYPEGFRNLRGIGFLHLFNYFHNLRAVIYLSGYELLLPF